MAGPDDDIVIDIPSDAIAIAPGPVVDGVPTVVPEPKEPEPVEDEPKVAAKEPKPGPDPELQRQLEESNRRIADMAKRLEESETSRASAESDRVKVTDTAWRTHWAKVNSDHENLKGHIAATDAEITNAERELQSATTDNDPARISKATRDIARLEAMKTRLEDGRAGAAAEIEKTQRDYQTWVEQQKARDAAPKPEAKEPERKAQPESMTADEWIETKAPQRLRSWFREHPEFVTPGTKEQRRLDVFVAQYLLDNDRNPNDIAYLNSGEFRQALNDKFFPSEDHDMADEKPRTPAKREEAPRPAAKERAPAAAPVSRSGNYYSSTNTNAAQVRLPPKLAAFVKSSGLDPTQYALEAVQQIKEGKLPKNFLDQDYDHNF